MRFDIYLGSGSSGEDFSLLERLGQFVGAPDRTLGRDKLVALAGKIYHARRLRARYFSQSLFGEPVWDMLLALYCFTAKGEALSVSGLCYSADVPQTTALRWVQLLEQKKLISRSKDRKDGRRALVALTDEAKSLLEDYLATIHGGFGGQA